jgi:hypothetical protein
VAQRYRFEAIWPGGREAFSPVLASFHIKNRVKNRTVDGPRMASLLGEDYVLNPIPDKIQVLS